MNLLRSHLALILFVSLSVSGVGTLIEVFGLPLLGRLIRLIRDRSVLHRLLFATVNLRNTVVGLGKQVGNFTKFVGFPEFEVGGTLQELTHPIRLLHTRQFNHDASGLRQTLDVRLGNTKTVDTGAQHHVSVVQRGLRLFAQRGNHLRISGVVLVKLQFAENGGELGIGRSNLLEGLLKKSDEITL